MDVTTAFVVASVLIGMFYFFSRNRNRNTPPGPAGLPIVGYLPFMTSKPYIHLQNLAKTYGPVFTVPLGSIKMVVLSDYPSMKEAFQQDSFMGRPDSLPFNLNKETLETGAFNGLPWKEQRKFSMRLLKDLGLGKAHMEDRMKEEINELLARFEESAGHPIIVKPLLMPSMSNNIASMVYGKRLKYDDPARILLDKSLIEGSKQDGQTEWHIFFPWIVKLVAFVNKFRPETEFDKVVRETKEYTAREIDEHKRTLDANNIRDYIDGYLLEIQKRNDPAFSNPVLEDMVSSFFGAGSETVRTSVDWLILATAAYTDIQHKIQAEIDHVIGRDRTPSWRDHFDMPYTEATIMEMMRWRTIIPLNVLRYTLWDTELNGYFIPKHSFVLSNIWAVHHSTEYWGHDAGIFRPERFLSQDGKELIKTDYFIPFSIGKRACPGENLAREEIFLYFVSLLQKFNIRLPDGNVPDFEGELGIALSPKSYEVYINKRL